MSGDLASIEIQSGVNEKKQGFLTIVVTTTKRDLIIGQLDPATCRKMALDWLEAAEAAETDAIVARMLEATGLPWETVGQFIADMRKEREK